jgi:uracil-DNA glycosylase
MPSGGRSIPRPPAPRPKKAKPPDASRELAPDLVKAGGELVGLASAIRACTACERACDDRCIGTGYPRAPIMLLKEHPFAADLDAGAFADEADALQKAFDALGIPFSWIYGSTAVRCGAGPATPDQLQACAVHVLIEIEAVEPRVIVAFGPKVADALRALDGRCGLCLPEEIGPGAVAIRSGLSLVVTEPLPGGVTNRESKRRLWRDLRQIPELIGVG